MFDRAYFEAAMANGFEAGPADSAPFPPLTPAGLTDVARKQWVADFEVLVAYAQEERSRNSLKQGKAKKNDRRGGAFVDRVPSPPPEASTTARDSTKPPHPLRQAIQELYAANKKLANENALAEAKLQRMKATVGSLTSKLETKLETSQGHGDLMQRLSTAVNALLQHSAEGGSNGGTLSSVTLRWREGMDDLPRKD